MPSVVTSITIEWHDYRYGRCKLGLTALATVTQNMTYVCVWHMAIDVHVPDWETLQLMRSVSRYVTTDSDRDLFPSPSDRELLPSLNQQRLKVTTHTTISVRWVRNTWRMMSIEEVIRYSDCITELKRWCRPSCRDATTSRQMPQHQTYNVPDSHCCAFFTLDRTGLQCPILFLQSSSFRLCFMCFCRSIYRYLISVCALSVWVVRFKGSSHQIQLNAVCSTLLISLSVISRSTRIQF